MLRIADSLAYVAAARHVYVVVDDPGNDKARLFVKAKNNLAPDKHALRFMVGTRMVGHDPDTNEEIWAPHVVWDTKHVEVTATEAMEAADGGGTKRAAQREAEEFLRSRDRSNAASHRLRSCQDGAAPIRPMQMLLDKACAHQTHQMV
jgi:hypothetical protein